MVPRPPGSSLPHTPLPSTSRCRARLRLELPIVEVQPGQARQLERAELHLARRLAVALPRDGIDEQVVVPRVEDMRRQLHRHAVLGGGDAILAGRSEEPTSELQSLMRSSYAVFCFKKNMQHYQ